jgi:hypothetical protein
MARNADDNYATLWPPHIERPTGAVPLLEKIFERLPKLDGAACIGQPQLFDADRLDQAAQAARALEVCSDCPALGACERYADAQPRSRLLGVLAGRWYLDPRSEATTVS